MTYREFFRSIAGFYPHPYQERIAEQIAAGRSIILRVPTGAGKTWAAVAPFLYSLQAGRPIADRLLYALPLRSLATSAHAAVRGGMEREFKQVSDLGSGREYGTELRYCSLQIGSQRDDPFFESDVTVTTIDQLLSGYLFMPVSLPDRIGNINAGALVGSLVVLDEIHLLDVDVALGTAIEMLDRLGKLCQFVFMTATMSDPAVQWLSGRLGADVLAIEDNEICSLRPAVSKSISSNVLIFGKRHHVLLALLHFGFQQCLQKSQVAALLFNRLLGQAHALPGYRRHVQPPASLLDGGNIHGGFRLAHWITSVGNPLANSRS